MAGREGLRLGIVYPAIYKKNHFYSCICSFNKYEFTEPLLCSRLLSLRSSKLGWILFRLEGSKQGRQFLTRQLHGPEISALPTCPQPVPASCSVFWLLSPTSSSRSHEVNKENTALVFTEHLFRGHKESMDYKTH